MLRLGRLAEGWIAPPAVRERRELVRYRHRLVSQRSSCKSQVHGVMAKNGVLPARVQMWGPGGQAQLDALELPHAYALRLESLRDLIDYLDREVAMVDRRIHLELADDAGYRAIQRIDGVGRVLAAVFVAEIGDISRFPSPAQLCSWAGLAPRRRESDAKVRRGPITKQGSPLVHWAAIEAISKYRGGPKLRADYHRIADSTGEVQGSGGRGPQAVDLGVLRPAGRRDPLPRGRGRVSGNPSGLVEARPSPWSPPRWRTE